MLNFLSKHFYYLLLNIFSLSLFFKITNDVLRIKSIVNFDFWLNEKIVLLWQSWLDKLLILLTSIFDPLNLLILSLILLSLFVYWKKWYFFFLYLVGLGGGVIFGYIFKIAVQRNRPAGGLISETGFSFPSNHAIIAAIFFPILYYSFKNDIKNALLKNIFFAINIFFFLTISFSRVYLKVHWFSDVIAGFSLGIFWLTLLILLFKFCRRIRHSATILN